MWKQLISSASPDDVHFKPASDMKEIEKAEDQLNIKFPSKLTEFLKETNGVRDSSRSEIMWSLQRILIENQMMRNTPAILDAYAPFDQFLFFCDSGAGDLFGFKGESGKIMNENIYVWDHDDDRRYVVALSLEEFIDAWFSGKLSI